MDEYKKALEMPKGAYHDFVPTKVVFSVHVTEMGTLSKYCVLKPCNWPEWQQMLVTKLPLLRYQPAATSQGDSISTWEIIPFDFHLGR